MERIDQARILLVDDQPGKLLTYEAILAELGEILIMAGSGQEALEILLKQEVAVILLDVNMPTLDGFETARLIRQHPRFEKTAIIFVTAINTTDLDRIRGYELGAVDYVFVPIIPEILRAKVAVFAELYKKTQQLSREVEERRKAEDKVRQLNQELERRVEERTAQLEASNKELEAFSYSISHDLRAPLRTIDSFSRLIVRRFQAQMPPEAKELLQFVFEGSTQMSRLIDDLLRFSQMNRQALQKDLVAPADLVNQCLEDLQGQREGRRVEVVVNDLPTCTADPSLLKQVWVNLLGNAMKYTRNRDVARIEVGCQNQDDTPVYFVRDNGAGFDMNHAGKLFSVFQRLHPATQYEGTGVGLALVQRIIQRHGGRVWAHAEVEKGATFYFTLSERRNGT